MLSVASRCFGQVDTCDSKREYLCSIVGSCLCWTMGSDTNPYGYRCAVATREKTAMLSLRTIVLFTLHALLNAIIRCLQLNTGRCRGCNPEGGLLVIDAVGLTVYVSCCNARIFIHSVYSWDHSTKSSVCQLPICNSFTQHVISLWRDATSELWTPVLFP